MSKQFLNEQYRTILMRHNGSLLRMINSVRTFHYSTKKFDGKTPPTKFGQGIWKAIDGNEAATYIAYRLTETAFIYPISPATSMGEHADNWASQGIKNVFGQVVDVVTMQSEAGAAGSVHGALTAGGLSTTFTASQGLLLMIPNLYLIAGELMPTVFHISARAVAKHALTIFNDHSDVMACRQTGWAMLCSHSVQEAHDLALVAHISSLKARIPFMHFFDGSRTSAQINNVHLLSTEEIASIVPEEAMLENLRDHALNPVKPIIRGTGQRPDIFMQNTVAAHKYYVATPKIVKESMKKVGDLTGRYYKLYEYYGDPEADRVVIMMASATRTVEEIVDHLLQKGEKVGVVRIRLFRPWSASDFLETVPKSAKKITVMDRTREDGAIHMPLFLDVSVSFSDAGDHRKIVGGQYGLASKEFTPAMAFALFENMKKDEPKNRFIIGVHDDVTHTSLDYGKHLDVLAEGTKQCMFWGFGTDGTVGANKAAIKMISENTNLWTQGHFAYDSHKGGGVTISHLRFGPNPFKGEYEITSNADYIACHNATYVHKFDMTKSLRKGGIFLLNCVWGVEGLDNHIPNKLKEKIANDEVEFYIVNATDIARDVGLGQRVNTVMQACFYHLSKVLPPSEAIDLLNTNISEVYKTKGPKVIAMNHKAVKSAVQSLIRVDVPSEWKTALTNGKYEIARTYDTLYQPRDYEIVEDVHNENNKFITEIMEPVVALEGDSLPVSSFTPGGYMPVGTTKYEKRGIAAAVPVWIPDKCTQCNYCTIVCPHAVIRPFLFTNQELKEKPDGFEARRAQGGAELAGLSYSIQLATMDCTGCEVCVKSCPDDALYMEKFDEAAEIQIPGWEFSQSVPNKGHLVDKFTVKGSQFQEPLMEFSGACSGCGETPYVKLLTQLYGDRLMIANASGCSSVWGGTSTTNPYTSRVNTEEHKGRGPAWGRSLFEDNAEYGLGQFMATKQRRRLIEKNITYALEEDVEISDKLRSAMEGWVQTKSTPDKQSTYADAIMELLPAEKENHHILAHILKNQNMLPPISNWLIGGDGWAYDIGFGGLDHVLGKNENVNIMVLDTEMYSNTGGQSSNATPMAASVKFASSGKTQAKKELGQIAMMYRNVYVASCAMGANYGQSVKAIKEAEEYDGPSLILCYSPCIDWGIKMEDMMQSQAAAVDSGYWPLYRYDPRLEAKGEQPFQLDSKRIKSSLKDFLVGENRYAQLLRSDQERAEALQSGLQNNVEARMRNFQRMAMDDIELLDTLKETFGEQTGEKVLILYASETGNTEDLAKMVAYEFKRREVRVKALAYNDIDVHDLAKESTIINLVATCGQGDWPQNSLMFWNEIQSDELPPDFLSKVKFATFAMGDSGYVFFNECGELMDARFRQLGAQPLLPIGLGDDQAEDKWETAFQEWIPDLWNELGTMTPEAKLLPATHTVKITPRSETDLTPTVELIMPSDAGGESVLCPMAVQTDITPGGRDCRHIEWDIRGLGISYEVGDALGVWSTNPKDRVNEFLEWYGVGFDDILELDDPNESRNPPLPKIITAGQLFTQVLDIFGRPKRQFYEALLAIAQDEEKDQLEYLISKEGNEEMRALINETVTFADVLKMFPSAKMPIEYLIDFVPNIKPRLYSIGSAPEMHPDHIHLCIVEEDWTNSKGEVRHGQSTWFVRNQLPKLQWGQYTGLKDDPEELLGKLSTEEAPLIPVRVNPAVVHLPDSPKVPLIMVGLGTGMAPFRAFIQQRKVQKEAGEETGDMLLYFGARYEATEYLYGEEIEQFHAEGTLTHLKKAFSRDQEEKIYAQHRIEQDPELLYDYLENKGGSFYLCGPAGGMPAQMRKAVVDVFAKCGNMSQEEADEKVTEMQINGRYNVEVW